jgi:hypothetical protein
VRKQHSGDAEALASAKASDGSAVATPATEEQGDEGDDDEDDGGDDNDDNDDDEGGEQQQHGKAEEYDSDEMPWEA